jgi:hypothetical protein
VELTKLDPERTIKSLTDKEFEIYWQAIEHNEGWEEGREDFIERWYISGVHKRRKIIYEYYIERNGGEWITKETAVALASQNRLRAILVHMKNGSMFLRPEYGTKPFETVA